MVRNTKGGNKAKKIKSSGFKTQGRSLRLKDKNNDSCELYGKILKKLGGNPPYLNILCEDGLERTCVIRGKHTKRVWMNIGDFVIINYNKELSDNKGEIEHKFENHEISRLINMGELNVKIFKVNQSDYDNDDDDLIQFKESDDEDNEELTNDSNEVTNELSKLDIVNENKNYTNNSDNDSDIDINEI